jgi:hypothetical protein
MAHPGKKEVRQQQQRRRGKLRGRSVTHDQNATPQDGAQTPQEEDRV